MSDQELSAVDCESFSFGWVLVIALLSLALLFFALDLRVTKRDLELAREELRVLHAGERVIEIRIPKGVMFRGLGVEGGEGSFNTEGAEGTEGTEKKKKGRVL
jgi:hypothetical protein